MHHAKKVPAYKRLTTYVVGLFLVGVTGLCIAGALSSEEPHVKLKTESPATPDSSENAPKTAEEGQKQKDQTLGASDVPKSPESQSPATGEAVRAEPSTSPATASESPAKPSATPTTKPTTRTPTPSTSTSSTPKPDPKPPTEKPVYQFFIADDSEQNRTWCDTHPSGYVKVQIGTEYQSYYNDQDPSKAFNSWRVSNETETCP